MMTSAHALTEIPRDPSSSVGRGVLRRGFEKVSQLTKTATQAVQTNLKLVRQQGLKQTFNKVAPALGSTALGMGTVYVVKAGVLAGAGLGASGGGAVFLGASAAGLCVTGAQYAMDCYKAKQAGQALPELTWKNYGLKGLFNTLGGALGAGALDLDPETAIDKITDFFKALFNFVSGTAHAEPLMQAMEENLREEPVLYAVESHENVVFEPISVEEALSSSEFFEALDTTEWNEQAQKDLQSAIAGQSWAAQNIAHYAAHGLLGGGERDYDMAVRAALFAKDMGSPLSEKFLADLDKMGVNVATYVPQESALLPSAQVPVNSVAPREGGGIIPRHKPEMMTFSEFSPIYECHVEETPTQIEMLCSDDAQPVKSGDVFLVHLPDGEKVPHLYEGTLSISRNDFMTHHIRPHYEAEGFSYSKDVSEFPPGPVAFGR